MLFPTTLVGSYPQPEWLIDREKLAGRFPPLVRARCGSSRAALGRSPGRRDDPRDQGAGLDIIAVGEIRRESYSNRFATALEGIDIAHPGTALDRSGHPNPMPRIVGPIRRMHPVEVDDLKFLKRHTGRQVKMTVPGPFTMSQQAQNDFYPNPAEAAMDYAVAVNEEIRDLFAAGADIVQVDEPCMQARHRAAAESNYQRALAVARRQSAKTFELHAASNLARLWRDKGKRIEARDFLAPVYRWFSEGFDSPVLREAQRAGEQERQAEKVVG